MTAKAKGKGDMSVTDHKWFDPRCHTSGCQSLALRRQQIAEMSEDQIKHMVERFLAWRLPKNFSPDGGISFKATFNEHTSHPMKHEPSGTNLFDAAQAEAMVRHMLKGLPGPESEREAG